MYNKFKLKEVILCGTYDLPKKKDIDSILDLLRQVLAVHNKIRPDIFKANTAKYTEEELYYIVTNPLTPVFVATDESEKF